jgi:hypothetical protein
MAILNILHVIFISPFRFGNPAVPDTSDGSTPSAVVFACMSAIALVFNWHLSVQPESDQIAVNMLWILLAALEVAGTMAVVILLILICFSTSSETLQRQEDGKRVNFQLKFLLFSGFGVLALTGITLVITIECVETTSEGVSQMISTLLAILFIVLQMVSITYLRNVSVVGGVFINYLLGTILLVNVSMWFSFVTWKVVDMNSLMRVNLPVPVPFRNQLRLLIVT